MREKITAFLGELGRWVRYLYFMRFSLLLWVFPCVLVALDQTGARSLTSGLLVPEYLQGYLCVAFFLVSTGFVALISARVVVINGPERWGPADSEGRPALLRKLFVNDQGEWEWIAPLGSQILNVYVFHYLYANGYAQGVRPSQIAFGLFCGVVLAFFLWYVANAWYYLAYDPPRAYLSLARIELGKNAARTILFPRQWFFLNRPHAPRRAVTIEDAKTDLKGSRLDSSLTGMANFAGNLTNLSGYCQPDGRLYEGHQFSIVAVILFAGLYATIWPLAAPAPAVTAAVVALAITALASLRIDWVFWSASHGGRGLIGWKILLTAGVTGFWAVLLTLYMFTSAERFPILAVVLIVITAVCWGLAGIAFFADRYRLPVFAVLLIAMIVPRLPFLHLSNGMEEHYFSTIQAPKQPIAAVPTPAAILDERWPDAADDHPLIIVTATGGGLHASAWTTAVLAHLENEFGKSDDQGAAVPFQKHLLLLSTVSGGSAGLLTYLRELRDDRQDFDRMQAAAQCSSLEAVGWGLVYYDLQKALFPYFVSPSSGDEDLDKTPLLKDRTWSLRKSFARNLNNTYCEDTWKRDHGLTLPSGARYLLKDNRNAEQFNQQLERELTLRSLLPDKNPEIPAFTMNTTSVEQGDRFLLANYRVPHYPLDETQAYPAHSFLDTFGIDNNASPDLPLVTAAQLSATFTFVSSAARAPAAVDLKSVHFVDGGYYDNDGTVSAIEFLRYALAPPESSKDGEDARHLASIASRLANGRLRILWIEIRNSGDYDGGKGQTPGGNGATKDPMNVFGQMGAPLEAFWNAGNVSVTGRNRLALGMMDQAYANKLQIHRIIVADSNAYSVAGTDPLNWSLTPRQRTEVQTSAEKVDASYKEAKKWYYDSRQHWDDAQRAGSKPPTVSGDVAH